MIIDKIKLKNKNLLEQIDVLSFVKIEGIYL